MNDETYDEYIRNVLGYPTNDTTIDNSTFNNYEIMSNNDVTTQTQNQTMNTPNSNLDRYYPEIYKVVYPMVKSKCQNVRSEITNEDLDNMTDEIYNAIEGQNMSQNESGMMNQTMINQQSTSRETERRPEIQKTELRRAEAYKNETRKFRCSEEINKTRQVNRGLRDLIKILLIRELIGRPNRPGPRPPVRPPFRPGPGPRPGRPPFNREEDIYEN